MTTVLPVAKVALSMELFWKEDFNVWQHQVVDYVFNRNNECKPPLKKSGTSKRVNRISYKGVVAMMRKYLNPLKIRNAIVWMLFVAVFFGFIGEFLESVWLLSLTIILLLIFIVVSFIFWRCPNCKRRLPLRYEKEIELSYAYVCPRCEKRFFDDGTME